MQMLNEIYGECETVKLSEHKKEVHREHLKPTSLVGFQMNKFDECLF